MATDRRDPFVEALGGECSPPALYQTAAGGQVAAHVAYVVYRGILIAAASPDGEDEALAALEAKVRANLDALCNAREIVAAEEVNLVLERSTSGGESTAPPVRRFVRPMPVERAFLELDLGCDGALVFLDSNTGNLAIASRSAAAEPQVLRIGEPVLGDDTAARPLPVPGRTPPPAEIERLRREKAARIRPRLRCPVCRGELDDAGDDLACAPCARVFPRFDGRPVLAAAGGWDPSPAGRPESQNTYGQQVLSLIEQHRDGLVLDCGSGSPTQGFYNVVHLELFGYPHVDVITDGQALPFAADTFDAVLSEAVLEHVKDPVAYASEVARVLKPGGLVRLDAAFLQPYHGYPDHYFNMTKSGLREVVGRAGLELVSLDAGPHQHPWITLSLVLNGYLHGTHDPDKQRQILGTTFGDAIDRLARGAGSPFDGLTREAIDRLAAGFSCLARKPAPRASDHAGATAGATAGGPSGTG